MKNRRQKSFVVLVIIGALILVLFALSHWEPHTITEITEESSPCLGPCPVYKVIAHPHQAIYIGVNHTKLVGTYVSSDLDYNFCVQALRQNGFFSLWSNYFTLATDQGTVTVSAAYRGGRKTVEEYGNTGPQRLSTIQQQIDEAVTKAHWHKVSSSTDYP